MKRVLAVAVLGVAGFIVRRQVASRDAVAAVAPELRSPLLPFTSLPFTERKLRFVRLMFKIRMKPVPGVTVAERRIGGVRALVFTPEQRTEPSAGVLWLHGGGYVVGTPEFEARGSAQLAKDLGAVVVSPDYRLAPEHPFPAGLDDCMAVLEWMRSAAAELGIDPDRLAVIGASAGGGMSAAVAQRAHDEGIPLRAQVLVYPMLDDRSAGKDHGHRGRFAWTPDSNTFGWTSYLGRAPRVSDAPPEYASPGRRTNLEGLPPAWVGVGELDLFHDEDVAYAEALTSSGVPCELVVVPGMYHGADGVAPKAQSMRDFRDGMVAHLRAHLD